ncbi:DUF4870 domain-containing protein [Bacillus fonticola]|uniref:DUF4870 domain-containing protein n=1 Tax=Bacillus fonticola TaxID=2728853 RepID=UPI0014753D4E|nr:DUF4870 domain-containing protein [Bacillus fonticola]
MSKTERTGQILASLCYFSLFFAGFLFPIVVYFITSSEYVKRHAKAAFLSHLLPFILFIIGIAIVISGAIAGTDAFAFGGVLFIIIMVIVDFIILIWNVIKGIQVLQENGGVF